MPEEHRCDKGPVIESLERQVADLYSKVNGNVMVLREISTRLGLVGPVNNHTVLGRLDRQEEYVSELREIVQEQESATKKAVERIAEQQKVAADKRDRNFRWTIAIITVVLTAVNFLTRFI